MTIKPVADLYLIAYEDGVPYKSTRDAREANEAIGEGFKVEEFVSLENHRAAMLQAGNSPVDPDGWKVEAEQLAEIHGCSFVVFMHGEEPQCADPTKVIISFSDEGLGHHSAAPQQEVTSARVHPARNE